MSPGGRDHVSVSQDDFSFRVMVPAQAASHFNFLSQVFSLAKFLGISPDATSSQFVSKKSQFDD
jgi:hypothetical protein